MVTTLLPLCVNWDFSRRSRATNSAVGKTNWSKFELIRDVMVVLVTCMNEEDPIKNDYSDTQGQLTPQSVGDMAEIQTDPSFYSCPPYLQEFRRSNRK